jgi:hypothetical protein
MQRRLELDAARGWMLVWMTLTHLPTQASVYANQTFGFVSSAEGFIFLSALFTGLIYYRTILKKGFEGMRRRLLGRTVRLYIYHAALLAFAFIVAVPIAAHGNRPNLYYLLDYYFQAGWKHAVINAALLLYRPPLLDILPMYIIFLLLTPLVLTIGIKYKKGWKLLLGASFAVWLMAQLGLRQIAYNYAAHLLGMKIPMNEMGAFDLWAWQFLWVIGLWFGVRWGKGDLPVQEWAKKLVVPAAIIVPVLLVLRYMVGNGIELGQFEVCFDKWHLGIVRLIDFGAIAMLLTYFPVVMKKLTFRPVVLMGQASLQVFCAHLLFCFAGLTLMGNANMLSLWQQIFLIVITFAALMVTAKVFAKGEGAASGNNRATSLAGILTSYRNWQKARFDF